MGQSKVKEALACMSGGFNCAQAILSAYGEELGLDKKTALQIACGFGGGMGRQQEVCGAVTGTYLVLGLKYGRFTKEDVPAREKTYAAVQEFTKLFKERNQTTNCRELIGVDFSSGDREIIKERAQTICPKVVQDAAEILEIILKESQHV